MNCPDGASARDLARGALEAVRAQGLKVVATCPFVSAYIAKHPEFADLLLSPQHKAE